MEVAALGTEREESFVRFGVDIIPVALQLGSEGVLLTVDVARDASMPLYHLLNLIG